MPKISTAPDHTGISVKVVELTLQGELPSDLSGAVAIGHMDDFTAILDKSRPVKKYTPINDRDFSQIVSTGAVEYGAFSATVLFDYRATDGANMLEKAFDENKEIGLIIELNDSVNGGADTTIVQIIRVTKFASGGEKDGKMTAQI